MASSDYLEMIIQLNLLFQIRTLSKGMMACPNTIDTGMTATPQVTTTSCGPDTTHITVSPTQPDILHQDHDDYDSQDSDDPDDWASDDDTADESINSDPDWEIGMAEEMEDIEEEMEEIW